MVDVVSRRCDSPGCKRQPSGTTDATQVQFCSLHRGDGRAGYTLLMLAQRERRAQAQAQALEETQAQQRVRASGSWSTDEPPFSDYRTRWDTTSSGSSGGPGFGSQATPGSSGVLPPSNAPSAGSFVGQRASTGGVQGESFISNQPRRNGDGSVSTEQNSLSQPGSPQKHNPHEWVWPAQPSRASSRPPPLKNPAEAGVLGIAGRPSPPLDSTRGDSPGTEWTKPSSASAMYHPAYKRHCSPRQRSFSHSPEPGSRTMMGLTGSMANLQASSPASPNLGPGMSLNSTGTPSPSAAGIPTPPGSSGSAALPPPHGAPRLSAQRLPQPQFPNRAVPRSSTGGPPRPPRSLSPGSGMPTARSSEGFYTLSSSGRSPVSGVGFSPSGPTASPGGPGGAFSGVFSPGSGLGSAMSGGGLSSARSSVSSTGPSPRWASPRNRAFGHTRTRSQGSVGDTLEDLSIVDPGPPTLEPLRVLAGGPLRSPRDRWRGGLPERRNSEIILPLPDRTQPDPSPGPATDSRRRSFTASLFDQPEGRARPGVSRDDMDTTDATEAAAGGFGPDGGPGGGTGGGTNGALTATNEAGTRAGGGGNGGGGAEQASARWGGGVWNSTTGEVGFQVTPGYRPNALSQHMQTGAGDAGTDANVEAKETRRGSHMSVGTLPLTSAESMGDREGGVFFSAEP